MNIKQFFGWYKTQSKSCWGRKRLYTPHSWGNIRRWFTRWSNQQTPFHNTGSTLSSFSVWSFISRSWFWQPLFFFDNENVKINPYLLFFELTIRMKANFVILNHFSQRYPKIPTLDVQLEKNVGIAFDFMTICFDSFRTLTTLLPILKVRSSH